MTPTPLVSIVIPTYNRAALLGDALEAVRRQSWTAWELIVVDDGGIDETRHVIEQFDTTVPQSVTYLYQANAGPATARNTGIKAAKGDYIAFADSDDQWLPHHLSDAVRTLEECPDVAWAYASTRMVDLVSGRVIAESAFVDESGAPTGFCRLRTEPRGTYRVIVDDSVVAYALGDTLLAGLQTSVMRRAVTDTIPIPDFRVGEDQVFAILALKAGFRLAWTPDVHVIYRVHADSISAGGKSGRAAVAPLLEFVRAFESLRTTSLSRRERQALNARLARECFWNLGYRLQGLGDFAAARQMYTRAMRLAPFSWRFWKTYIASFAAQAMASPRPGR